MTKLHFPVKYIGITQGFTGTHVGIDMGWSNSNGGPNHDILAPADGKVIDIRTDCNKTDTTGKSYGNYIQIDHGNGINTLHAHLKYGSFKVKKGEVVKKGQVMAKMGATGHSTGIHLHYEVRINGNRKDPLLYTYATKNNVISANTQRNYKVLSENTVTPTVSRNKSKTQIKVLVVDLNVRKSPSTSSDSLGCAVKGGIYNILETKADTNYNWYKIADNQWIANNGEYCEILLKEENSENDKTIQELNDQIDKQNESIKLLEKEIEELKENGDYTFNYECTKTGNYKIKLYEGEVLYIKSLGVNS